MEEPTARPRRSVRWLAAIWVLGTIAAVTVSVAAVRLAGEQARYQIAFREDLAALAERLRRP